MIDLAQHFVDHSLFAGPPDLYDPKVYISNSGLSEIKRVLLSEPSFLGDEIHLIMGGEAHKRCLEKKKTIKLSSDIEYDLTQMKKSFEANKFCNQLMKKAKVEQTSFARISEANFMVIVDIEANSQTGADLKTTSCRTEKQFIELAIKKYDYIRQGWSYKKVRNFKDFYFIGLQKKEPYGIFILNMSHYAKEEKRSEKEALFLIDWYKNFGRAVPKSPPISQPKK